jgi:hypothetical protein
VPVPLRPVPSLLALVALALCAPRPAPAAPATLEEVTLGRTGYDDALIERASGERYRLDLRGCNADLRGYGGRTALLWCPVPGPTVESRLLVPDFDLDCAVWKVDTLELSRHPRAAQARPEEGLTAMRQALEMIGYDCGPPGTGWGRDAAVAFLRFRESKRLDATEQGMRRAITSLALDVLRGRQATGTGLRLSRILSLQIDALTRWLLAGGQGRAGCTEPAWIRSTGADGRLIALSDGTTWRVTTASDDAPRWTSGEQVTVCVGRMIYWPTGEMVRVHAAE